MDIPLTVDRIAEHEEMALSTNFPRVNLDLPNINIIVVDTSSKLYMIWKINTSLAKRIIICTHPAYWLRDTCIYPQP